jgi:hypothetical protein
MEIELDSGRIVFVENFEMGYTYGGLIQGLPDEEMNKDIFERCSYPSDWGKRKTLKIRPSEEEFQSELNPACYSVMLTSDDPINKGYHGSELVVIWFGENPKGKTIESIIEEGVISIDWEANAEDFKY